MVYGYQRNVRITGKLPLDSEYLYYARHRNAIRYGTTAIPSVIPSEKALTRTKGE